MKFSPGHHKLTSGQLALGCCSRGLVLCCLFSSIHPRSQSCPECDCQNLYLVLRSSCWANAYLLHQVNWRPASIISTLRPPHLHGLPPLGLSSLSTAFLSAALSEAAPVGASFLLRSVPYLYLSFGSRGPLPSISLLPPESSFNILNRTNNSVDYLFSCTHPVYSPALGVLQGSVLPICSSCFLMTPWDRFLPLA